MKRLFVMLAVVALMTSCGGNSTQPEGIDGLDTCKMVKDSTTCDTVKTDSVKIVK